MFALYKPSFVTWTMTFALSIITVNTLYLQTTHCPPRTALGSTVNVWDWRQTYYDLYLTKGYIRPQSPLRFVNNTVPVNTEYIAASSPVDYEPSNGWELLYKNFGTSSARVPNASFALYNRYTGLIRVLFYVPNSSATINAASVAARSYRAGSITHGSQIFSFHGLPIAALNKARPSQSMVYVQPNHMTTSGAWVVLDFATAFDPCVCNYTSAIEFAPTLQSISKIDLVLEGTGKSEAVYSKVTGSNNAIDIAGKISNGFVGATKRYKDYQELIDEDKGTLSFLSDFKFLPAVGGIISLLDFFVTGKKTSPMLLGYNSNYKFVGEGTLNFLSGDYPTAILTPGAKFQPAYASIVPVYDNPLGVFNLLMRPKINKYTKNTGQVYGACDRDLHYRSAYQLDLSSIKYAINTAAGLQGRPLSIQAALRFRNCNNPGSQILSKQLTEQAANPGVFYSPLMDIDCLGDYPVILDMFDYADFDYDTYSCTEDRRGKTCTTVDLLLLVAVRRINGTTGQETILSLVYEAEQVTKSFSTFPVNKYEGKTVAQINATCPQVTIMPVDKNYTATFCGNSTTYNPSFITKSSGSSVPYTELANYDPTVSFKTDTQSTFLTSAAPNPVSTVTNIEFSDGQPHTGTCTVTDIVGRPHYSISFIDKSVLSLQLHDLSQGVYFVNIFDDQGRLIATTKIVMK